MKSKRLLDVWYKAKCTLCLIALQSFLCTALWANDKKPTSGAEHSICSKQKTTGLPEELIKGQITDDRGEPVAGVNVSEKGTNNTVVSDKDGKYSINVKDANSILLFSHVGYLDVQIKAGAATANAVKLELLSKNLDDVVVVGYGTQKKKELTNAVVQVSGAEVKKSTAASLSNSLSGRLAGLFVNQRSAAPGFDDAQIL
ncbi:MAG TPA: carboxypeptidase-like regulatory domain-containing protein, partial [Chitinophagaceae bacterium]|nr:carboxypeptidase-like regulatory domain-containing protein [Chitinophagaceae bacterium]